MSNDLVGFLVGGKVTPVTPATPLPVTPAGPGGGSAVGGVPNVGAGNIVHNQVSVGTSPTLIVAARTGAQGTGRVDVVISSTGGAPVYLGGSSVTTSSGLYLGAGPGSSVVLSNTAAIYGVVATGTVVVTYMEEF
jgi:hypothetical protein